jgi:hypothetical protein
VLFPGAQPVAALRLIGVRRFESGIVQLHYRVG